jgi:hypothetical protein
LFISSCVLIIVFSPIRGQTSFFSFLAVLATMLRTRSW